MLAKKNVRASKYDDLVEEVDLLHANPEYAWIKRKDGTESTVSLRQLAPRGNGNNTYQNDEPSSLEDSPILSPIHEEDHPDSLPNASNL